MSICTIQLPIVRIFKDFDRMSAQEQQIAAMHSANDSVDDGSDDRCVINFIDTSSEEKDGAISSNEEDATKKPKQLRQRKRSTTNTPYKMSKAFSESHALCRDCNTDNYHHNPCHAKRSNITGSSTSTSSGGGGGGGASGLKADCLRKRIVSVGLSTGYAQYQMALLEVPMPRDYCDASSDDLSSEWDSDVQETHRSPKVFIQFLLFFSSLVFFSCCGIEIVLINVVYH